MNNRLDFVLLAGLVWNIVFFWLIGSISLDIPFFDDFDALGEFILSMKSNSFGNKFSILFSQYAEHKIVYTRIIAWIDYLVTGHLHFKFLIFWGMLGLVGLQVVFFKVFQSFQKPLYWFLPFTFIIVNFQYWENLVSAMTSLQNLNSPFFAILFCYLIAYNGYSLSVYFVAFLAIFTSGNGILLLPLGIFFGILSKQSKKRISLWVLFSLLLILLYFLNYSALPSLFGGRTPLSYSLKHPIMFLENLGLFLTSVIEVFRFPTFFWNYLVACFILSILFLYSWKFYFDNNRSSVKYFILLAFAYLVGTSVLVALNRGSDHSHMFFSRYRIYSSLGFCLVYLACLEMELKGQRWIFRFFAGFSIVFFLTSFHYLESIIAHFDEMKYGAKSYHLNNKEWHGLYPPYTSYFSNASSSSLVSQKLDSQNIYIVPFKKFSFTNLVKKDTLQMKREERENYILFRRDDQILNWQNDQFAILISPKNKVLIPLKTQWSSKDLIKKILNKNTLIRGFEVHVTKHNINHGNYDLYVFPDGKPYFVTSVSISKVSTNYYHN
jgi:hypothetical protein